MIEKTLTIQMDEVSQMKAVALFIQKASDYRSTLHVLVDNKKANAKSLLGVMSLGLTNGMSITLTAEGSDETEAVNDLAQWLESGMPIES